MEGHREGSERRKECSCLCLFEHLQKSQGSGAGWFNCASLLSIGMSHWPRCPGDQVGGIVDILLDGRKMEFVGSVI